jgi:hypothetical protein
LAVKLSTQLSSFTTIPTVSASVDVADAVKSQVTKYFSKMQLWSSPVVDSPSTSTATDVDIDTLQFWDQHAYIDLLAPLAQDLACVPASQAYVERSFSLCSFLCAGRRSHMKKSLEMRVFLKLNKQCLDKTGFDNM